jgi:hypothetical protein
MREQAGGSLSFMSGGFAYVSEMCNHVGLENIRKRLVSSSIGSDSIFLPCCAKLDTKNAWISSSNGQMF